MFGAYRPITVDVIQYLDRDRTLNTVHIYLVKNAIAKSAGPNGSQAVFACDLTLQLCCRSNNNDSNFVDPCI